MKSVTPTIPTTISTTLALVVGAISSAPVAAQVVRLPARETVEARPILESLSKDLDYIFWSELLFRRELRYCPYRNPCRLRPEASPTSAGTIVAELVGGGVQARAELEVRIRRAISVAAYAARP